MKTLGLSVSLAFYLLFPSVQAQGIYPTVTIQQAETERFSVVIVGRKDGSKTNYEPVELDRDMTREEIRAWATEQVESDPSIVSVEPDFPVQRQGFLGVTDPLFTSQWHLNSPFKTALGERLGGLIDYTATVDYGFGVKPVVQELETRRSGSLSEVVVAVVDTGVNPISELSGKLLAGYDFDGNDTDVEEKYCSSVVPHGTNMSTLIAGGQNNGLGGAGIAPSAKILPVKVFSDCSPSASVFTLSKGIRWAAGEAQGAVAPPAQPAKIINVSLGAAIPCPNYLQDAVDYAMSQGAIVVASAGNNGNGNLSAPAVCTGVIGVQAHTVDGLTTSYSNYSPLATVSAPGGGSDKRFQGRSLGLVGAGLARNTVQGVFIESNAVSQQGTSQASALVSGFLANVFAGDLSFTSLSGLTGSDVANAVRGLIRNTALPYGSNDFCVSSPTSCAPGLINGEGFLASALSTQLPPVFVNRPVATTSVIMGGEPLSLDFEAKSFTPGSLTYQWSQVGGVPVSMSSLNTAQTTVEPLTQAGVASLKLTVTDAASQVLEHFVDVTVSLASATPAPSNNLVPTPRTASNSGDGGGGSLDMLFALCLLFLLVLQKIHSGDSNQANWLQSLHLTEDDV